MVYLGGEDPSADATRVGFEQTVIGLVAFLGGVVFARYALGRGTARHTGQGAAKPSPQKLALVDSFARYYLLTGGVAYFLTPLIPAFPSSTAVLSPLQALVVVGACLRIWVASKLKDQFKFWSTMALLPLLPLVSVVHGGFLGYGIMWALVIAVFLFTQSNRKVAYILFAPVVFFAGLSLFVNYMAAREDLRQLVWYEQASTGDRLQRIVGVFQNFEALDLSNTQHSEALGGRLNQNFLVGVAVDRLEAGQVDYAYGETFGALILALIPRAVWPDKPAVGGGGSLVHDFTGIDFAEGTSVGAGQVLEFYVNFGTVGVIGGFLLFGLLIGRIDLSVARYLDEGNQRRFVFWFLICLALLNPGGNLLEVVVTAAASAVVGYGVGRLVNRYGPGNTRGAPPAMARQT
jgi:energy-coupling factor transporter transmembrane protein EcfT